MNYNKRSLFAIFLSLILIVSLEGCSLLNQDGKTGTSTSSAKGASVSADTESTGASSAEGGTVSVSSLHASEMFTDRDKEVGYDESTAIAITLSDSNSTCDSDLVEIAGDIITIKDEGTYLLSGSLANGQVIVEAEDTDKLQLVLNGVNINCDTSAAIYVRQADKVVLTLAGNTDNMLSNKNEFIAIDDNNIDSVVFSKDDLTLNGAGTLTIDALYGHGIVSKDDLVLASGTYHITAANHALSGKDSIRIADGSYSLNAGKDGIHAENTDDTSLGFIYIAGGTYNITSAGDGMDASSSLQVDDGTIKVLAGGGIANAEVKQDETFRPAEQTEQNTATAEADTISTKGLKATTDLVIISGSITIDSADDALHSNANLSVNNGELMLTTGDDGIHADAAVTISGGNVTVENSYEGIEGQTIDITGGTISVVASDDGLNAAGGNDQSGFGGNMKQDNFAADSNSYIKIEGGTIKVDASGDGIDSNGNLYVSGGETYVAGPTNGGNGVLDYNGEAQITGGIFVAVGASGMAQNFGSTSTQGAILAEVSTGMSDKEVIIKDSSDTTLLSYTPPKTYNSVVISCPEIKQGETYSLEICGQSMTVEMTDIIYGSGSNHMGGGKGGKTGGRTHANGDTEQPGEPPAGEAGQPEEPPAGEAGQPGEPPAGEIGQPGEPPSGAMEQTEESANTAETS